MGSIGGDVGHRVELAPSQGFVQGGKAFGDFMRGAKRFELLGPRIYARHKADAFDLGEMFGMVGGHAACAKDQNAHGFGHQRNPFSPSWCRRGPRSTKGSRAMSMDVLGASLGFAMRAWGL